MSKFRQVSHVIFDMDGILLGEFSKNQVVWQIDFHP